MLAGILARRHYKDDIAKLANVKLYVNSKRPSTINTDTDFVWRDIKSEGEVRFIQSSGSDTLRPVYNEDTGLIAFNSSDILSINTPVLTTGDRSFCITCAVGRRWNGDYYFIGRETDITIGHIRMVWRNDRLTVQLSASQTYEFTGLAAEFGAASAAMCIVSLIGVSNTLRLRINGVYHSATITNAWAVGGFTIKHLGYDLQAAKNYVGNLGAIVLYDGTPSAGDLTVLETTLKDDFGVTF